MDTTVDRFKNLSVASVSDAMDHLGVHGTCLGIVPLREGFRIAGRAFTVKYLPVGVEKGTVGDFVDDVPSGEIVVLDNAGRPDCTVWGDILTSVAHHRGLGGTVIHGVCRDVARSLSLGYPVFSRGKFMRTGKDMVQAEGINVPVSLGDVQVRPGDILLGNDDGVVVVPQEKEEQILTVACSISEAERLILEETLKGERLASARTRHKYHELQRG